MRAKNVPWQSMTRRKRVHCPVSSPALIVQSPTPVSSSSSGASAAVRMMRVATHTHGACIGAVAWRSASARTHSPPATHSGCAEGNSGGRASVAAGCAHLRECGVSLLPISLCSLQPLRACTFHRCASAAAVCASSCGCRFSTHPTAHSATLFLPRSLPR
jgi:hypothetical protein